MTGVERKVSQRDPELRELNEQLAEWRNEEWEDEPHELNSTQDYNEVFNDWMDHGPYPDSWYS